MSRKINSSKFWKQFSLLLSWLSILHNPQDILRSMHKITIKLTRYNTSHAQSIMLLLNPKTTVDIAQLNLPIRTHREFKYSNTNHIDLAVVIVGL